MKMRKLCEINEYLNKYHHDCSFSAMKFRVVSKLETECGEKLQCLRNPDFVRFSQKISRNPDDTKKQI